MGAVGLTTCGGFAGLGCPAARNYPRVPSLRYPAPMDEDIRARVDRLELPWNAYDSDPYGVSKHDLVWFFTAARFFYRDYFRVRTVGVDNVPDRGRAMLVGNHSGGIALDALIVIAAMFLEK